MNDPRIDAYIAKAPEFARPILRHVRKIIHRACPDVHETIKWGHPGFEYEGLICGMAAFKQHAALGFWKGRLILDGTGRQADSHWGQMGKLYERGDLPPDRVLERYVRKAVELNVSGVTVVRKRAPRPAIPVPADLAAGLAKRAKARATFERLAPSHRREYLEWITEAKTAETRTRRLATTLEWLAEGKARNWKVAGTARSNPARPRTRRAAASKS
jgi:uncharacterized protein YdeI (YjbR/CyaY-like superfamily)